MYTNNTLNTFNDKDIIEKCLFRVGIGFAISEDVGSIKYYGGKIDEEKLKDNCSFDGACFNTQHVCWMQKRRSLNDK